MESNCSDVLIEELQSNGIDTIFGIPGVHTLDMYRSLVNSKLRHITSRHEQGCAFMADGYARVSAKPAACLLISGPGLLNAATAIGESWSDSVPIVVVASASSNDDTGLGRGTLHEMTDQLGAMKGILQTQAIRLNTASQVYPAVNMLMSDLHSSRPRPVYLEVPLDVAIAKVDVKAKITKGPISKPGPDIHLVAKAANLIKSANKPVIIIGGGARNAIKSIEFLINKTGAVIISSLAGKGIFNEYNPSSLGSTLYMKQSIEVLNEADLLIVIGTQLSITDHYQENLSFSCPIIRIDIDHREVWRDYYPSVGIVADSKLAVDSLNESLRELSDKQCWNNNIEKIKADIFNEIATQSPLQTKFLDMLVKSVPNDVIIVSDMTQIAYTGSVYCKLKTGSQWLHPSGFGTLGYGLPAAIGAKIAKPKRCVVALVGDYGVGFTFNELATAVDEKLGIPIIIWNNQGLGQIAQSMDKKYIPRLGVELQAPNFSYLALGYGANYKKLLSISDLANEIKKANMEDKPTVIEIDTASCDFG